MKEEPTCVPKYKNGRMEKQESGTGTGTLIETGVNWEALKPVPDCTRYPRGNKIQDGILCYRCFEKTSAQ